MSLDVLQDKIFDTNFTNFARTKDAEDKALIKKELFTQRRREGRGKTRSTNSRMKN